MLAINVRTEIMFAASVRDAVAGRERSGCRPSAAPSPCWARAHGGNLLVARTGTGCARFETTIVLEARQHGAPDYVTVVEAGLLAKTGMNSAGLALVTNALVCGADKGAPGFPYHVLLRSILDAETVSDALAMLQRGERPASANYLLAHADGLAVDVEAAPGDHSRLFLGYPDDDLILHTNHFLNPGFDVRDVSWSCARQPVPARAARAARGRTTRARSIAASGSARSAITGWRRSGSAAIPIPRATSEPGPLRDGDGVIMDPAARRLWLAWAALRGAVRAARLRRLPRQLATVVAVAARERRPGGELARPGAGRPPRRPDRRTRGELATTASASPAAHGRAW